jgi:hypothetical protein
MQIAKAHVEREALTDSDPIVLVAWDHLLNRFSPCKTDFLLAFASDKRYANVLLTDVSKLTQNPELTIRDFIDADKLCFFRIAYHSLSPIAQLLFYGKCDNATRLVVDNDGVSVEGAGVSPIVTRRAERNDYPHTEILLKCDDWSGKYLEYDLVTDFWPVISLRLFDCLKKGRHVKNIDASSRAIEIEKMSNGITTLGELDPCMVHPRFGVFHEKHKYSGFSKKTCKVGMFEIASNDHWLFELNGVIVKGENLVRNILFMFVSPRPLNTDEEARLQEYESSDPEYVKGVKEGWSLLFLGRKHMLPIIRPGVVSRSLLVTAIPEDIIKKLEGEEYHFLDGSPLLEFREKAEPRP